MNREHRSAGLTSIIIPCWSQLEFTQQCLASLKEHTRPAWELIVIDNGSTDGTAAYLAGVRDMASVPVTVVTNTTNLGFPAAINQGLRLARGEYLVLLNNDVVVTDRWLDQLIGLVNAKRRAGDGSGSDESTPSVPEVGVSGGNGPTPPGPPFARGGKVLAPPSVDPAQAGVESSQPCAAPSSLPTAYCEAHQACWPHV
jgi:glycosyltransferase involved in cell wall biosynthesis